MMAKSASDPLPRADPESLGIDPRAVADFLREADRRGLGFHGFMLARHGAVAAEAAWKPYRLESRRKLYSLSKSFASTAVGLAVSERRLSVEDPVLSFFPGKTPKESSDNLRAMKVRHLLTMTTGHATDSADRFLRSRDPVAAFLALPVELEPGSRFVYDSGATFMLSALVQRLTGQRISDYLKPRLFDRIGIEGASWERHPCGIDLGGVGLRIGLEDIARFGQLYLDGGAWKGERVLSGEWIEEATSKRVENADPAAPDPRSDWQQGYGYQFWRCKSGHYRADGAFGQYCVVMPDRDAVIAAVSGAADMQAQLDLLWDRLLPAIPESPAGAPSVRARSAALPSEAAAELRLLSGSLSMRPPASVSGSAGWAAGRLSYAFGDNWAGLREMSFDFGADALELAYRISRSGTWGSVLDAPLAPPADSGRRRLRCGYGEWFDGTSWLDGEGPKPASCAGAWTGPDTFAFKLIHLEEPKSVSVACVFSPEGLRLEIGLDVNMGPTSFPPIEGRPV
jgi:CubicO group peptidase (beta-lactamase class C family)